jgi:hypothetical protein
MATTLSLILQSMKEEIVFSKEHAEFLTVTCKFSLVKKLFLVIVAGRLTRNLFSQILEG